MTIFEIIKNNVDLDTLADVMTEMTVKHIKRISKEQSLGVEISNFDKSDIRYSYVDWLRKEYSNTERK